MWKIKTWDEFEKKAIPLIRCGIEFRKTEDFKKKGWPAFIKAFGDERKTLYRAYISGAEDDVDRRLRQRRADRIGLSNSNMPHLFFSSDEDSMQRKFAEMSIACCLDKLCCYAYIIPSLPYTSLQYILNI